MDLRTRQLLEKQEPEILLALIDNLRSENESLRAAVQEQERVRAKQSQCSLNIEEQVKYLRRKLFGRSKEIRLDASDRLRDKSQNDVLLFSQSAFPCPELSRQSTNPLKSLLDEKVIYHKATDEELLEEARVRGVESPSADQWEELEGVHDKVIKIGIIETRYEIQKHLKCKYKLKREFNPHSDKEVIVTARGPEGLLPGMNYTTEFVASVVADKYISHLPLERQARRMASLGLKGIKTSTLSRHCALAAASLEPMQGQILVELKNGDTALHLDETPWKIQNKDQKDGFMWVVSSRLASYYEFNESRSGRVIRETLADYEGPVLTDGFSGYSALDDPDLKITQGYCWVHARRNFIDLEKHDESVKPILDDIDELFAVERKARDFTELIELRQSLSRPITERLKQRLLDEYPHSRPGSQKRKGIEYLLKRWDGFTLFLAEPRLPLSNNEAERTIRHAVMGRKNYYGAATHSGARTAATLFTIIETCKKNELDPRTFLLMALKMIAKGETPPTPLEYARQTRQ